MPPNLQAHYSAQFEDRRNGGLERSMIFSDLPAPAEASIQQESRCKGFAQAGNRYTLFGIMLWASAGKLPAAPVFARRPH